MGTDIAPASKDASRVLRALRAADGDRVRELRRRADLAGEVEMRRGRHALQIEINRSLYMNEVTLEKTSGFHHLRAVIDDLVKSLLPYLDERFRPAQLAAE